MFRKKGPNVEKKKKNKKGPNVEKKRNLTLARVFSLTNDHRSKFRGRGYQIEGQYLKGAFIYEENFVLT